MSENKLAAARARADQQLAHLDSSIDEMIDLLNRDEVKSRFTESWALGVTKMSRELSPQFAAQVAAILVLQRARQRWILDELYEALQDPAMAGNQFARGVIATRNALRGRLSVEQVLAIVPATHIPSEPQAPPHVFGAEQAVDPDRLVAGTCVWRYGEQVRFRGQEFTKATLPCHDDYTVRVHTEPEMSFLVSCPEPNCHTVYDVTVFDEGDGGYAAKFTVRDDIVLPARKGR